MRTLKRTLCLVLALVMVLGLGVNAFAFDRTADDFRDKGDAKHTEALEVLTAIGVVEGNNNGTVTPKETLSRQMAAVFITKVLGVNVTGQALVSQFPDVHNIVKWGEEYIAYCEYNEIISGYPDGKFYPEKDVTGNEFGLMLLRALGYDVKIEGIGGDGWDIETYRRMTQSWANLTKDLTITEWNDPITRDDAFQLMFNALVAYTVYYPNGIRTRVDVAAAGTPGGYKDYRVDTNGGPAADADFYIQLCENSYPGLTLDSGAVDGFNRPGRTWSYNRAPITFIANTPIAVYHSGELTGAKAKTYTDALAKHTKDAANVYYNGSAFAGSFQKVSNPTGTPDGLWVDDKTGVPGYEIEIYATPGKETTEWDVIVREAYLARIANISDTTGDISLEVYEHSKVNGGTGEVAPFAFTVKAPTDKTVGDDVYPELKGYMEGEYLAVYLTQDWTTYIDGTSDADDFILETAKLTPVETSVKHIYDNGANVNSTLETDKNGTFQVNNEAMWSNNAFETALKVSLPGFNNGVGAGRKIGLNDTVLYTLDGTVLFVYQAKEGIKNKGYAYLWDTLDEAANDWVTELNPDVHKVRLILDTDGDGAYSASNKEAFTEANARFVNPNTGNTFLNAKDATDRLAGPFNVNAGGILVYYERDNKGTYTLSIADKVQNDQGNYVVNRREATSGDLGEILVSKGVAQGQLPEATSGDLQKVVYDQATKFYIVSGDPAASKYETIEVVTGIKDVPNQVYGEDTEIQLVFRADNAAKDQDEKDNTNITKLVDYVVIKNAGYTAPSDVYFIVGSTNVTYHTVSVNGTAKNYYEYWAVAKHNAVVKVYADEIIPVGTNGSRVGIVARSHLKYDADLASYEVLDITDYIASDTVAVETAVFKPIGALGLQDVHNGVIVTDNSDPGVTDTPSSYSLAGVPIYMYNTSNGSVQTVNYSRVQNAMAGYYVLSAGKITALYIWANAPASP